MKTKLLTLLFACFLTTSYAQIDLKINPIGALFGSPDITADFMLNDKFSVEGGLGVDFGNFKINDIKYKRSGFSLLAVGKHYFNPDLGADKFGIGVYTRFRNFGNSLFDGGNTDDYTRTRLALGFQIGWKRVSESGFIFEFDLGAGRALVDNIKFDNANSSINEDDVPSLNIDGLLRIAIGYRISK
ncbi:MAG: DUF3575 domain-containing protein [Saprospiraceae bacterium]